MCVHLVVLSFMDRCCNQWGQGRGQPVFLGCGCIALTSPHKPDLTDLTNHIFPTRKTPKPNQTKELSQKSPREQNKEPSPPIRVRGAIWHLGYLFIRGMRWRDHLGRAGSKLLSFRYPTRSFFAWSFGVSAAPIVGLGCRETGWHKGLWLPRTWALNRGQVNA